MMAQQFLRELNRMINIFYTEIFFLGENFICMYISQTKFSNQNVSLQKNYFSKFHKIVLGTPADKCPIMGYFFHFIIKNYIL